MSIFYLFYEGEKSRGKKQEEQGGGFVETLPLPHGGREGGECSKLGKNAWRY